MQLPHPKAKLAGCMWLPRLAAKIRIYLAGELPWTYRLAFGNPIGVDGRFLRHFRLSMPQVITAVRSDTDDNEKLAAWFLERRRVSPESIASWNSLAVSLGAPGKPGCFTFRVVKWFLYRKSCFRSVGSIFEAIAIDEGLTEPNGAHPTNR